MYALALLLSEIGQSNGIEVNQQEMNNLVQQAAQQYPQEQHEAFVKYLQENQMAAAQLRAPLFEDKVVDFLFEKAKVTDKSVTREALEAAIEEEPKAKKPADCKKKAVAKKPAAKKAPEKKAKATPAEKSFCKESAGQKGDSEKASCQEKARSKKIEQEMARLSKPGHFFHAINHRLAFRLESDRIAADVG